MKLLVLAASLIVIQWFSPAALASEGSRCHFHGSKPATEAIVTDCATRQRNALVNGGKLEGSWQSAKLEKLELVDGKKGKEWKAVFTNPGATDKTKQYLYVFFSHPGNLIAVNFTGQ